MSLRHLVPPYDLPITAIRDGFFSDKYFLRTRNIIAAARPDTVIKMQVFQKQEARLAGMAEALEILRECSGEPVDDARTGVWHLGWGEMRVHALADGLDIAPLETVLTIEGPFRYFAHLETVYLGVLARRTMIATNVRKVVDAARGKPVMFMPARHDVWNVQKGDGWAALEAGASSVSTDAQGRWSRAIGQGTIPHALIAAFDGNTVEAALAYARHYAGEGRPLTVLVDFDNNCARTALDVARSLREAGYELGCVRLDTSESLVDMGLISYLGQYKPTGVNVELTRHVRQMLDHAGFQSVKIMVSGGFTPEKIASFEDAMAPVDSYGVGSSLLRGSYDFTADVVVTNGMACAKVGRKERHNPRLELVK